MGGVQPNRQIILIKYIVNQTLKYYHFRCCTQKLVVSRAVTMLNDELVVLILVWSATGEAVIHCWVHRCRLLLLSRLGTGDPGLAMVSGGVPLLRGVLGDSDIQHGAWQVLLGTAFSHNWGR